MRHNKKKGMKLGTDASHTRAMKKNLVASLLANDRIKTLDVRAKAIRPDVDKVITWAKKGDIHSRRLAIAKVGDKEVVREVFDKAAQGMWADRSGGYTRIMKLGPRKGDAAEVVIIELVTEPVASKAPKTSVKKVARVEKVEKAEKAAEPAGDANEPAEATTSAESGESAEATTEE
ncbi:LSU ribosomal protein L17P [Olsenella uli DSM 7084]|uniref:50S ribosomal protein L17 n=1 Tax=Olsenella uli (strain ATCC 49627 / DSM 7084 / CCUG 31166 / CIP 109912 / JCM 12494 / LMG 11480 / NCIMB 702895 / VPI D76D-27C) TaxID=633147 RepID=E1QX26_OLSUV|nr:50S ribosomal protein L17 [Olsenella uli]ADK68679.1 LSU ribosomal protein L17P [Olsenella uli DSM 7084]